MIVCMRPECQTTAGCQCRPWYPVIGPIPSPRTMPVSLPFSSFGVTIAIMDSDGNLTIKVDQPTPDPVST
jgi:hypothetical protein